MNTPQEKMSTMEPAASLVARAGLSARMRRRNVYHVECRDEDGNLKWKDTIRNLVVNEGLDDSLDKHLLGSAYTAAWYVGLTSSAPTVAAGDTLASHAGWTEETIYSQTTRPAATFAAVASQSTDNSASPAVFSINGAGTIGGCFIAADNTISGTTGVLYGAGAFTGGDKTVASGDTLNVTVTCTAAA